MAEYFESFPMRKHMRLCVCVYARMCVHTHAHVCVYTRTCACVCVCVCVCVCKLLKGVIRAQVAMSNVVFSAILTSALGRCMSVCVRARARARMCEFAHNVDLGCAHVPTSALCVCACKYLCICMCVCTCVCVHALVKD